MEKQKIKHNGEIFTPERVFKLMLNSLKYKGERILKLKIMEPSFGEGAFLLEIIERIIKTCKELFYKDSEIIKVLENNVFGIEKNKEYFLKTINNIKKLLNNYKIKFENLKLNLFNDDSLKIWNKFINKMDIVIGNPPYIRSANLNQEYREFLKEFEFYNGSSPDIYLFFIEISYKMLKDGGKLSLITPNSWFSTNFSDNFRKFLLKNNNLKRIYLLGNDYMPFKVAVYTTIFTIIKNKSTKTQIYRFIDNDFVYWKEIELKDILFNNNFYFKLPLNYFKDKENKKLSRVKNGASTGKNNFFIQKEYFDSQLLVPMLKASTGKREWVICPYKNGKLLPLEKIKELDIKIYNLFIENKELLLSRDIRDKNLWWSLGRDQSIPDFEKEKIGINNIFRDKKDIKLNLIPKNSLMYSGYYILTELTFEEVKNKLINEKFIEYINIFGQEKASKYFTLTAKFVELYLNML